MEDAFTVWPMNQEFSLEPGQEYTGSIFVTNPSDATSDFVYRVSVAPYSVIGEEYDADFMTPSNMSMMVDWITVDKPSGVLKPNETTEVTFTIKVPEDVPAGGQYASIMVTEGGNAEGEEGVSISSVFEVASLIYANVAGETRNEGEILENNIVGFTTDNSIRLDALVNNTGNTHLSVTTVVEVANAITGEVILPTEQDVGRYGELILPGTTRRMTHEVTDLPVVGVVKVAQTVYYNGVKSSEVKDVIICPIWFMVIVVAIIVGIFVGIFIKVKKRKQRKFAKEIV